MVDAKEGRDPELWHRLVRDQDLISSTQQALGKPRPLQIPLSIDTTIDRALLLHPHYLTPAQLHIHQPSAWSITFFEPNPLS